MRVAMIGEPVGLSSDAAELIEKAAGRVVSMKLQVPVVLFLECMKPFTFLAEQGLILLAPLLMPVLGPGKVEGVCAFLAERSNVDRLVARIEELSEADA